MIDSRNKKRSSRNRVTFESHFFSYRDSVAKPLFPLIDGDIITYRCGFACKDDEPVANALHSVKLSVLGLVSDVAKLDPDKVSKENYKLYITGKGNFREKVATLREYKGSRKHLPKPKYYNEIREYMIKRLGAVLVEGMEADDAIGIEQYSHKDKSTCICTIDKDLNMIPGWHYNFVTKKFYYVRKEHADLYFLYQLLQGDRIDDVPGLHKIGPAKAFRILKDNGFDFVRCARAVRDKYEERGMGSHLLEIAKLLWIRRCQHQGEDQELFSILRLGEMIR